MNDANIKQILSVFQDEISKNNICIGFFDIETQFLFNDIDPNFNSYGWNQKQKTRYKLMPEMKIAVSGILEISSLNINYLYFEDTDIVNLEQKLLDLDKIIGYNLLEFDYHILKGYFDDSIIDQFKAKTIDIFDTIKNETNQWAKLDDLGKLNLGISKSANTLEIPKMWREGNKDEVIKYLKTDLELLAGIFYFGFCQKPITYYRKEQGKPKRKLSKKFDWSHILD